MSEMRMRQGVTNYKSRRTVKLWNHHKSFPEVDILRICSFWVSKDVARKHWYMEHCTNQRTHQYREFTIKQNLGAPSWYLRNTDTWSLKCVCSNRSHMMPTMLNTCGCSDIFFIKVRRWPILHWDLPKLFFLSLVSFFCHCVKISEKLT